MTQAQPKKSDLPVRAASAVVMIAVAGTALWLGGWVWFSLVSVLAFVCIGEFVRLIVKATPNNALRSCGVLGSVAYVGLAASKLTTMRHGYADDGGDILSIITVSFVLGVVICTDVGAYFAGRTFGGPKIAPSISPSKTWAGLFGGMLAAALWSALAYEIFFLAGHYGLDWKYISSVPLSLWAPFAGAALAIIAQAGDFFESWLKRRAGVKDSSNLIPGHGGVFDRLDGLLPVVIASIVLRPF